MAKSSIGEMVWVGMDAHKKFIVVHRLVGTEREGEEWRIENRPPAVKKLARRLRRDAGGSEVRCCYEAGPVGFVLQRQLELSDQGIVCEVVAPSLIPTKPGDRVKTDRRDARKLTMLLRADTLTAVQPPSPEEEAVRDLCRCREAARHDLMRARHRLSKFLLRRALVWREGSQWTLRHRAWLRSLRFEQPADGVVFEDYLATVEEAEARMKRLSQAISDAADQDPYREPVGWLRCYRGIDTVTALTVVAELHGVGRFASARQLMAYLGLVPSEHSSGDRRRQGSITKTGNSHVRRVLVEAAWCQRYQPRVSQALRKRRDGQPDWVIAQADRAMHRLHRRYWKFAHEKKPMGKVVTAIARELAGFLWATLHQGEARRQAA